MLLRECGLVPTSVFDTQLAAALCMPGNSIGLGRLTEDVLGVVVDKSQQNSGRAQCSPSRRL